MRVLLVTHYFPPEIGAPQARLSELARLWSEAGDEVTVLTGMPNHPTGRVPPSYRGRWRLQERVDGYRVVRTWLYATPNEKLVRKTLGHLSFMVTSLLLGATPTRGTDVVVVSSPTFFSVGSAWALARMHRARLVVEIRDLWPAIFVELGVLTNRAAIRMLETLELAAYRAADAVVVVSEGFRDDLVRRGVPNEKLHTIRNGADLDRFHPAAPNPAIRRRLGAGPDQTLVLYAGAHGIAHGLTTVAEAAAKLVGEPVHFAFVGEGAAKADLAAKVEELGLGNVTMLGGVPRDDVPSLLAAADVCLAPLRDVPLFSSFIPSKIFEYLAAGKPVIGSVTGEPASILALAGAMVVPPEDSRALAGAIRTLAADPARRVAMGAAGHHYVAENFDRAALAQKYRHLIGRLPPRSPTRLPRRPHIGPLSNDHLSTEIMRASRPTMRALGTAIIGPARWAQRTGYARSALLGRAVDARGRPIPWYCLAAIDFLQALDFSDDSVLEFGSGQSTLWWASKASTVVAIEESPAWYSYVQGHIVSTPNATVLLESDLQRHARLPLTLDRSFDVVAIDGGDRAECAASALKVIRPTGIIIVDNSEGFWGTEGTYPILQLFDRHGWMRLDFPGYAPGVLTTSVTSVFFRDGARFLHLPPPRQGAK